ncbi:Uncharacterised protein [Vibrio cholerae]|nr:Uncharacterised protein [Vibrio cholerae]
MASFSNSSDGLRRSDFKIRSGVFSSATGSSFAVLLAELGIIVGSDATSITRAAPDCIEAAISG